MSEKQKIDEVFIKIKRLVHKLEVPTEETDDIWESLDDLAELLKNEEQDRTIIIIKEARRSR